MKTLILCDYRLSPGTEDVAFALWTEHMPLPSAVVRYSASGKHRPDDWAGVMYAEYRGIPVESLDGPWKRITYKAWNNVYRLMASRVEQALFITSKPGEFNGMREALLTAGKPMYIHKWQGPLIPPEERCDYTQPDPL